MKVMVTYMKINETKNCLQIITDDGCVDLELTSMPVNEFIQKFDMYSINDLSLNGYIPVTVYYDATTDECPYIGIQYNDSRYGIIGGNVDRIMPFDEMIDYFLDTL